MILTKTKNASVTEIILLLSVLFLLSAVLLFSMRFFYKKAYPIKFTEYVEKYCDEYSVDKFFVYAVMRTESNFNPNATSSVGARGLMQFTESTYDFIGKKLSDNDKNFDDMYDAETAVKYGVYLISYLSKQLGCEENVLCGYHAGINKTKQWLSTDDISQNGIIIKEKIPYKDTKLYVEKVIKTYKIYQKLYKQEW